MDRCRSGIAVALLLAAGSAVAATQGPPVYTYTGAAPSGTCAGTRVWIDALGTGTYYCNAGTWAAVSGGGGATPGGSDTQVQFNDGGSFGGDAGFTYVDDGSKQVLSVGTSNTALNGFKAVAGTSSTLYGPLDLRAGSNNSFYTINSGCQTGQACSSSSAGVIVNTPATNAATVNTRLFEIHKAGSVQTMFDGWGHARFLSAVTTSPTLQLAMASGSDAIKFDTNGARLHLGTGTNDYLVSNGSNLTTPGSLTATGGFVGNASTATALAANPTNCSAGQAPLGIDASGNVEGCFTPGGGSPGHAITDEGGAALTTQPTLNFVGAAVTATNDGANSRTNVTIPWPALTNVLDPTGDWTATWPSGTKALWTFTGSTDNAFSIHGDGAFTGTGDLVHINKTGTGAAVGSDALHVEVTDDTNMTGVRVTMVNATRDAINTNAKITAGGGFVGALTGNASTATALAANPTNCGAGQAPLGIDASGNVEGCFTPGGGGGGSPGGAASTLQFNNAGSFGGASNLTSDGEDLLITGRTTHPTDPAAGQVKVYAFQHRGASGPTDLQIEDGAVLYDTHLFPYTRSDDANWGCVLPAAYGSTAVTATGSATVGSATGTAAAVTWSASAEYTRHKWVNYPPASNAINTSSGYRAGVDYMWRGNAAGIGGFYWWGSFGVNTTDSNARLFVGLKDATAVIGATTDPSAALDTVYVGCNATQTTLRVCSNDGTGAATCTDLGANYPCTTGGVGYDVAFWAAPNAASIGYWISRLDSRANTTSGTISTDLPRNTLALGWDFWRNNGGTADAIAAMHFGGTCWSANP